jgi:hypothetical protein
MNEIIDGKLYCYACDAMLPVSEFYKDKYRKSGYDNRCKKHRKEQSKKHYEENVLIYKEYNSKYYSNNREQILEQQKQYRKANPEKIAEYFRRYYQQHKVSLNAYRRRYRQWKKLMRENA